MKLRTILALFVFAASLANATVNYVEADLNLTNPLSEFSFNTADLLALPSPPSALPQPDTIEAPNATIIRFTFDDNPNAPCAWIELFHQR